VSIKSLERNRLFALYGVNYLSGAQIARILRQTFGEFDMSIWFMQYSPAGRGILQFRSISFRFASGVPLCYTRVIVAKAQG